jgi:hypothetical protein
VKTALPNYEKLGAFYLGKEYDLETGTCSDDLVMYDAKDLTTHAVCVGMTGSGKTGLCLSLLEEAAIDSIPVIAIDPKGDLGNIFLTFPQLKPRDFRPWIDESEAAREGLSPEEYAAKTAQLWREGLASWGQSPARIKRFRDAVDMAIYTPGSTAGLPITVLRSFSAPSPKIMQDAEAFRERVASATSGLLALLGIEGDPIQSREHILISNILQAAWRTGRDMDLPSLIREIQNPPFHSVGVLDLETFYPPKDRTALAMTLNNLLASPTFAGWLEGEPLNIKRLLYTEEGQPRLSVMSIAHLNDSERMFFVTILLNEILAWVRTQPGTSSLRAMLYMDEVYGYFPPTRNPPSKTPMLTLLKQARAYGFGCVLATQNPVDLDYKGLANTGTWFLGRLQTERDKARVLEGLEGASIQAGQEFNKAEMEATLAGLGQRVFLMNNVHENRPVTFQTRWALSYLRGPLTRQQIKTLMDPLRPAPAETATPVTEPGHVPSVTHATAKPAPTVSPLTAAARPVIPEHVKEAFLEVSQPVSESSRLVYRPAMLGTGELHFVRATYDVDEWRERALLQELDQDVKKPDWEHATAVDPHQFQFASEPHAQATFADVPVKLLSKTKLKSWKSRLKSEFYETERVNVWKCDDLKIYSEAGETEGDFRVRLRQAVAERRDLEIEKLRKKYESKMESLQKRIRTAEEAVKREQSQYEKARTDSYLSIGSTLLGAFFGRKIGSRTNVSKATTSARSVGRASQQADDVERAQEKVSTLKKDAKSLSRELEDEIKSLEDHWDAEKLKLEELEVTPRKSDIRVDEVQILWTPWLVDEAGIATPAFNSGD